MTDASYGIYWNSFSIPGIFRNYDILKKKKKKFKNTNNTWSDMGTLIA